MHPGVTGIDLGIRPGSTLHLVGFIFYNCHLEKYPGNSQVPFGLTLKGFKGRNIQSPPKEQLQFFNCPYKQTPLTFNHLAACSRG
ncbi:hypothetical protein FKM82_005580 [Ascaphus truei]